MESKLKKTFESIKYVSTTADSWTRHKKSYIGITAHWIDPSNFHRAKAAFARKRIKGRHTYDVVATEMEHAITRITEISMPQLATICIQLGLRAFSEREYKFLLEYCKITKPLTKALDRLQGEMKYT